MKVSTERDKAYISFALSCLQLSQILSFERMFSSSSLSSLVPKACEIALAHHNLTEVIDQQPKNIKAWLHGLLDAEEWEAVEEEWDIAVDGASRQQAKGSNL